MFKIALSVIFITSSANSFASAVDDYSKALNAAIRNGDTQEYRRLVEQGPPKEPKTEPLNHTPPREFNATNSPPSDFKYPSNDSASEPKSSAAQMDSIRRYDDLLSNQNISERARATLLLQRRAMAVGTPRERDTAHAVQDEINSPKTSERAKVYLLSGEGQVETRPGEIPAPFNPPRNNATPKLGTTLVDQDGTVYKNNGGDTYISPDTGQYCYHEGIELICK